MTDFPHSSFPPSVPHRAHEHTMSTAALRTGHGR
jgi:hypothetical protein